MRREKVLFVILALVCLLNWVPAPAALGLGLIFGVRVGNPFHASTGRWTRILLQSSVVLLGFGMNLGAVVRAGREGFLFSVATIAGTLVLGLILGSVLKTKPKTSTLIAAGTAICGGSAIAAVAPAIDAENEDISVSLGTVFILNAVALVAFPLIGHFIGLSPKQFGLWAAIAIHDTSSVVGAAARFGGEALEIATTVKLVRALWIAPVALVLGFIYGKGGVRNIRKSIPWFVLLFIAAALIRSYAPNWFQPSIFDALVNLAKAGLNLTLYLIGAGLTREALRRVGLRAFSLGVILWIVISVASLIAVRQFG